MRSTLSVLAALCFLTVSPSLRAAADEPGQLPGEPGAALERGPALTVDPPSSSVGGSAQVGGSPEPRSGPFFYDFDFQLEISGTMSLLARTRYCRSEDLHLKLAATRGPDGWHFHSLGLAETEESPNFGIGEGPKKHQRYLLVGSRPSGERERRLRESLLRLEVRCGCALEEKGADGGSGKKAYFNEYLWDNPSGAFQFLVSPVGRTVHVTDRTQVTVLSREGGGRAKPRFFETLKYAMLAVPPYLNSLPVLPGSGGPVRWQMGCGPLYEGLVELVRNVYGRKMTVLDPEALQDESIRYEGEFVPGTSILRVRAEAGAFRPAAVRVSGFKGSLWIESFRREVCLDREQGRVLRDVLELSFGIRRETRIFPVSGDVNRVRLSLVEAGPAGCDGRKDPVRTEVGIRRQEEGEPGP